MAPQRAPLPCAGLTQQPDSNNPPGFLQQPLLCAPPLFAKQPQFDYAFRWVACWLAAASTASCAAWLERAAAMGQLQIQIGALPGWSVPGTCTAPPHPRFATSAKLSKHHCQGHSALSCSQPPMPCLIASNVVI